MNEQRAKGCLIAAVVWCLILGSLGVAYRFWVHPYLSKKLKDATGSTSRYKDELVLAADSFSGYCVLRSDAFKQELRDRKIKLIVEDTQYQVPRAVQVLAVQQRNELGMRQVIFPGEPHQAPHTLGRIQVGEFERLLGPADMLVGRLERGQERLDACRLRGRAMAGSNVPQLRRCGGLRR